MILTGYHIALNWAWRPPQRHPAQHPTWEWFGVCGPFRVIKLRPLNPETANQELRLLACQWSWQHASHQTRLALEAVRDYTLKVRNDN